MLVKCTVMQLQQFALPAYCGSRRKREYASRRFGNGSVIVSGGSIVVSGQHSHLPGIFTHHMSGLLVHTIDGFKEQKRNMKYLV